MMTRFFLASFVAVGVAGLYASNASAQSVAPCGCGMTNAVSVGSSSVANGSGYQRFSYEPTPGVISQPMALQPVISQPAYTQPVYSQPMNDTVVTQPRMLQSSRAIQSYRRFSYQPSTTGRSNYSNDHKEKWEYSKTDPRKYR